MIASMMTGKQLVDIMTTDPNDTAKFHIVSLKDGSVQTIDSKINVIINHMGAAYEKENGQLVLEAPSLYSLDTLL